MASQTKVREMIAKNNAKKGGLSDKIVPIILAIIFFVLMFCISYLGM